MLAKTFAINYLHLYGVFCNASYLLWLVLIRCEYQPFLCSAVYILLHFNRPTEYRNKIKYNRLR